MFQYNRSVTVWGCHSASSAAQGAQAVSEGVEAHGFLTLRSFGTAGVLGILPVGFLLFV